MRRAVISSAVLLLVVLGLPACDQRKAADSPPAAPASSSPAADAQVPGSAVSFMNSAAVSGMLEEQASRLAEQKSNDFRTRELAKKLAKDHAQANQELAQLAAAKDVALPKQLDQEHAAKLQSLQSAAPDQFDSNYAGLLVAGHNQAVMLFEQEAKAGQDPDVQAFAQRQLPKLRAHLEQMHELPNLPVADRAPSPTPTPR